MKPNDKSQVLLSNDIFKMIKENPQLLQQHFISVRETLLRLSRIEKSKKAIADFWMFKYCFTYEYTYVCIHIIPNLTSPQFKIAIQ